jgi:hypothetical protein
LLPLPLPGLLSSNVRHPLRSPKSLLIGTPSGSSALRCALRSIRDCAHRRKEFHGLRFRPFSRLLAFYLVCWLCVLLSALSLETQKTPGETAPGFYPSSTSMGNALQQLQIFTQPRAEYVLQEKYDEDADEDDVAGPEDPTGHFRHQVARIRRGEEVNQLTVLLRKRGKNSESTK